MFRSLFLPLILPTLCFLTGCQKKLEVQAPRSVAVICVGDASKIEQTQRYTGQIRARHEVRVGFRVAGKIQERLVEVGQVVQPGQLLAKLDDADYHLAVEAATAEVEAAEASHHQANADLQRIADLFKRAMMSQSEFDAAKSADESTAAQLRRATRMLELAKNRLSYCELKADSQAVVLEVLTEAGSVVPDGTPIFKLAQIGEWEAVVSIPENRIDHLEKCQATVQIWADAVSNYSAKVREISPATDPLTRTFQVRFSIVAPTPEVRLGMTATVLLSAPSHQPLLSIPMSALILGRDEAAVWVLNETTQSVHYRPLQIAQYGEDCVEVQAGLQAGEWIVRAGGHLLQDEQIVKPWYGGSTSDPLVGK